MKKKIMALFMALSMAGFVSAIDVNENLSISGFIDGSYNSEDKEGSVDEQSLGIDEVEVDFLFNAGGVSAELHIDSEGDSDWDIEQVHMTYTLENGLSVTLGRFASNLGLEREDPGGIYAYSRGYETTGFNLGDVDNPDHVQEGLRFGFSSDVFGLAVSAVNDAADSGDLEDDDLDIEISFSYTGIENLTIGGGAYIDNDVTNALETDVVNLNGTYIAGKALVGFDYTELDSAGDETEAYMAVVDYDVSDKLGVALRYSSAETSDVGDTDKITVAPNYAITESLGAILEYSDIDNDSGANEELIALELTFTF